MSTYSLDDEIVFVKSVDVPLSDDLGSAFYQVIRVNLGQADTFMVARSRGQFMRLDVQESTAAFGKYLRGDVTEYLDGETKIETLVGSLVFMYYGPTFVVPTMLSPEPGSLVEQSLVSGEKGLKILKKVRSEILVKRKGKVVLIEFTCLPACGSAEKWTVKIDKEQRVVSKVDRKELAPKGTFSVGE